VLPEGESDEAVRILGLTFEIPKVSLRKPLKAGQTKP
jgi:hypothetical protein